MFGVGDELFVGAFEVIDFAVAEVPDAGGDFVDDVVVVRDQQDGAIVPLERNIQRVDGFQIEVVGRLVEDQEIRLLQHEFAEDQARRFSAGQRARGFQRVFAAEQHLPH